MSKQTVKPSMPGPYDPPAKQSPKPQKPAQNRKPSQPSGVNKFYDGPTVAAKAEEVKKQVTKTAQVTVAETKHQGKRAAAAVRRHPWSFISILTTLPFLITMSLFSTVVCPPPSSAISPVSRFVLSPLGLHDSSSQHSQLHQTLCYPANVYHSEILQPYVYPVVEKLQDRAQAHPIYVKGLEPAYRIGSSAGQRAWEGPVRPVVERIQRGARRVYLTFVEPHLPYIKTKARALTAPYTSRLASYHETYLSPHINTAGKYSQIAGKWSVESYNYVKAHPLTGTAAKYANKGFHVGKARTQQAYRLAKPHAVRAGKEAERITREILGPRVMAGLEWSGVQVGKGWVVVKQQISRVYYAHLDPYVGPYIAQAQITVAPYSAAFHKHVYTPYIFPALEAFLPPAVLAPEPPKSFWALIADILPGSSVTEHKADMKRFHTKVDKAAKPANVRVPGAEKIAKAESATKDTKEAKKFDKEEMVRVREAIKERVNKQGKQGYDTVRQELLDLNGGILSDDDKLTALKLNGRNEIEREFEYLLKGLDKLYTASTSLTREQVQKSSLQADVRVARKVKGVQERVDRMKQAWHDMGNPIVKQAQNDLDAALGTEYSDLESKMSRMEDVTSRDWTQYKAIREVADSWAKKYTTLHNGESKDRALAAPAANVARACSSFSTELVELLEAFRDQVRVKKKLAYDRIEAREALAAESSKSAPVKLNTLNKKAEDAKATILPIVGEAAEGAAAAPGIIGKGKDQIMEAFSRASAAASGTASEALTAQSEEARATILPVVEAGAGAAAAAAGIIGKGKDQIMEALNQASAAASGTAAQVTSAGIVDQVKEAAVGAYSKAAENIEDASSAVASAVGSGVPAQGISAQVQSVVSDAGNSAQAAYEAASSVVHDATRSAMSAVGATPSPETPNEHLESLVNVVKAGYASVSSNVGDSIHDATRAGMKAVGATPSPEGLVEHAESLVSGVSASASSVAVVASASVVSIASEASVSVSSAVVAAPSSAASLASEASASISSAAVVASSSAASLASQASASVSSAAVVASASAASLVDEASASVASAAVAASASVASLAGEAGNAIHDATRSAASVIGVQPTPDSYAQSAESIASVASASIESAASAAASAAGSVVSEAGSAAHSATRAMSRAAGVKPTPESPAEYVEKAVDEVKRVAAEAAEGVRHAVGRDEL